MTEKKFLQEPDRVPTRRLASLGLAGLLAFGVGALWATTVQRGATGTVRSSTAPRPELAGQREVGMVYQPRFGESIAKARDDEARRRLSSAGVSSGSMLTVTTSNSRPTRQSSASIDRVRPARSRLQRPRQRW